MAKRNAAELVAVKLRANSVSGPKSSSLVTVRADNFCLELVDGFSRAVFRREGKIVLSVPETCYLGHWALDGDDCL